MIRFLRSNSRRNRPSVNRKRIAANAFRSRRGSCDVLRQHSRFFKKKKRRENAHLCRIVSDVLASNDVESSSNRNRDLDLRMKPSHQRCHARRLLYKSLLCTSGRPVFSLGLAWPGLAWPGRSTSDKDQGANSIGTRAEGWARLGSDLPHFSSGPADFKCTNHRRQNSHS